MRPPKTYWRNRSVVVCVLFVVIVIIIIVKMFSWFVSFFVMASAFGVVRKHFGRSDAFLNAFVEQTRE